MKVDRKRLAEAQRVRAGAIGLLACCACTFPLEQHATSTRHAEDCPAHGMTLSAMDAGTYRHFEWKISP